MHILCNILLIKNFVIQTIIDSPVHPVTAVSPLTFVICVTAVKQGYEDWLRHKNDDMVNNRPVKVVREGEIEVYFYNKLLCFIQLSFN